jgi:predicted NBD/HSP70 family sugar kinase
MRLTSRLVDRTVQKAGVKREQLAGVGVGLAGPIDLVTGRIHPSSIAPSWQFVDARKELEDLLDLPVYIDNDANLGALAEMMWGAGRGVSEAAYVKVDTGVGVGIVVQGRIYRGATGTAGEIGHSTVDENGPVCRCGNRGCLEGLVGTPALLESLRTRYRADLTMDDVLRLAIDGDIGCRRALADAGRLLGVQVANLCNLLNPRLVMIAGKLSEAGEIVLDPLRTSFARHALPHAVETVEVVRAAIGDRATALGAAAAGSDELEAECSLRTLSRYWPKLSRCWATRPVSASPTLCRSRSFAFATSHRFSTCRNRSSLIPCGHCDRCVWSATGAKAALRTMHLTTITSPRSWEKASDT